MTLSIDELERQHLLMRETLNWLAKECADPSARLRVCSLIATLDTPPSSGQSTNEEDYGEWYI